MYMRNILIAAGSLALVAPGVALGGGGAGPDAGSVNLSFFGDAFGQIAGLINQLIPLLIAVALLLFIWGMITFILAAGDEDARRTGRHKMVWSIIALFVIVSVWGLVGLLNQITGVEQGTGFIQPETGL